MVKRSLITKKPVTNAVTSADSWVVGGGIDPEIQITTAPIASAPEPAQTQGKLYPHRISFDLSKEQYKRLKFASFELERPMNEVLRAAVETWLQSANY